jgi:hypothetical protein
MVTSWLKSSVGGLLAKNIRIILDGKVICPHKKSPKEYNALLMLDNKDHLLVSAPCADSLQNRFFWVSLYDDDISLFRQRFSYFLLAGVPVGYVRAG